MPAQQLKIEKGIPLQPRRYGSLSQHSKSEMDTVARKMTVGDSVLLTYPVAKNATQAQLWKASHKATAKLRKAIERLGMKAASRSVRPGKIRVWALKK